MYQLNYGIIFRDMDLLIAGLRLAIEIAVISLTLGSLMGLLAALLRTSRYRALHTVVDAYVEVVRNIPLLLILFIVYFGFPTMGIYWFDEKQSVIFALIFYSGAYMAETFRAGIESVERPLIEAGKAIGLTNWQVVTTVVLPLMFRVVLPSMGSMLISLFKDTSLAAAISVRELTYAGVILNVKTWRVVEIWSVIGGLYIVTSMLLSWALRLVERRLAIPK